MDVHLEALRERNEVVELPYWLAMKADANGYIDNVRIWRLGSLRLPAAMLSNHQHKTGIGYHLGMREASTR